MFCVLFDKKHTAFKWKLAISGFPVSPDSSALVRWDEKIKYPLIAYFLSAKNKNQFLYVRVMARQSSDIFIGTQCIITPQHCPKHQLFNLCQESVGCLKSAKYRTYNQCEQCEFMTNSPYLRIFFRTALTCSYFLHCQYADFQNLSPSSHSTFLDSFHQISKSTSSYAHCCRQS